jgi:hypothetical protein
MPRKKKTEEGSNKETGEISGVAPDRKTFESKKNRGLPGCGLLGGRNLSLTKI